MKKRYFVIAILIFLHLMLGYRNGKAQGGGYVMFNPGQWTPIGLKIGGFKFLYIGARMNDALFAQEAIFFQEPGTYIENEELYTDDSYSTLEYLGEKIYSRYSLTIGYAYSWGGENENAIGIYGGTGYAAALYRYEYQDANSDNKRWVLDKDLSFEGVNLEAGINIKLIKNLALTGGIACITDINYNNGLSEFMFTFGAGFAW